MNEKHTNEQLKILHEAMQQFGGVIVLPASLAAELKEYERIAALPWDLVAEHVRRTMLEGLSIGPTGYFYYCACEMLLKRYDAGERTQTLFEEMRNVH